MYRRGDPNMQPISLADVEEEGPDLSQEVDAGVLLTLLLSSSHRMLIDVVVMEMAMHSHHAIDIWRCGLH